MNGFHKGGTEGNVVHEVSVHDVAMDPIRTRGAHGRGFLADAREVARENRGRNDDFSIVHGDTFSGGEPGRL
jgi:hypothetical protein